MRTIGPDRAALLTPEGAARLLDSNTKNRPLRVNHVSKLANIMERGEWRLNGDTIVISDNGVLIDGQHRLAAVVKSGISIKAFIISGLPFEVFATKDRSKARSSGDILGIDGHKNATLLASTVVLIDRILSNDIGHGNGRYSIKGGFEPQYVRELVEKYDGVAEHLKYNKDRFAMFPRSVLCACSYLFSKLNEEKADEFFDKLLSGNDMEKGDPILLLRERVFSLRAKNPRSIKVAQAYVVGITIKTWNAWSHGRKMVHLKYGTDESFPKIEQ